MRVTVFCPEALIDAGNHLAMVLAQSPADAGTYAPPVWTFDGGLYSSASFNARPEWLSAAQQTLMRPAWDTVGVIDMDKARAAQAVLDFWLPDMPGFPPVLSPSRLIAVGGVSDKQARALVNLVPVEAAL